MKSTLLLILFTGISAILSAPEITEENISKSMHNQAVALIKILDDAQKSKTLFPFEVEERMNWYYTPVKRKGLPLKEMSDKQQALTYELLKTTLSDQGFTKAQEIIWLENILRIVENRPENDTYRDPENYLLSFFGNPSEDDLWGWRFEGHHLSLNFSTLDNRVIGLTPTFMGSNPAEIQSGEHQGKKVLRQEMELANQLLSTFSAAQKEKTVFSDKTFRDIVTTNQREVGKIKFEGISYQELKQDQQKILDELINVYFSNLEKPLADKLRNKMENNGKGGIHFAWAGSLKPNEAYYYRIHSEDVLIEFDNSQNNANHVHTVVRDLENDWGKDVLKSHYESGVHQH